VKADASERATALWTEGRRWDAVMQSLRTEGYSKIDCIRASVDVLRLPLADAKRLVHESDVWRDLRDADDEWHDALIAELGAEALPRGR
jgi:ribosomal protein L7/L12